MATASVAFMVAGGNEYNMPAFGVPPMSTESVGTDNESAAAPRDCYCRVYTDGAMNVAFGPTGTTPDTDSMVIDGEFTCWVPAGTVVAVADV